MTSKKILVLVCAGLACVVLFTMSGQFPLQLISLPTWSCKENPPKKIIKDFVNNTGGLAFLNSYEKLFKSPTVQVLVKADPNSPNTITTWWQAAAMIEWYMKTPFRYNCKNIVAMGNWKICQDEPYTVKPPCLAYSFGINFDFSFDDAMAKLGCEVHSFDPSMKRGDHKRGNMSYFHNLGIGGSNTDAFIPRHDVYVKDRQVWKIRTVKSIMRELGHENRVIDVFKMDVESYEWYIADNMLETDVFKYIRQFITEFHLFADFPLKEDYINLFKIYTRIRELGLREFGYNPQGKKLAADKFNLQSDVLFVNSFFERKPEWK